MISTNLTPPTISSASKPCASLKQRCEHHRKVQNRRYKSDFEIHFNEEGKKIKTKRYEYKNTLLTIKFSELLINLIADKDYSITNRPYLIQRMAALYAPTQKGPTLNTIKNLLEKVKALGLFKVRNLGRKGIAIAAINRVELLKWLADTKKEYKEKAPFNSYEYQRMLHENKGPTQKDSTNQQKDATYYITSGTDRSMPAKPVMALSLQMKELKHSNPARIATLIALKRNSFTKNLGYNEKLNLEREVYHELLHKTQMQHVHSPVGLANWIVKDKLKRAVGTGFNHTGSIL